MIFFFFFYSVFVLAWKGNQRDLYFKPSDGLKWIPGNIMNPHATVVTHVPVVHPGDRLKRWNGKNWRKSENSFAECAYMIATYCPPNGIVLDDSAGTMRVAQAAMRLNRHCIVIEKDKELGEDAIKRLEK